MANLNFSELVNAYELLELQNIWRDLLGIENINYDDNFFALGASSPLAIRLLYEVEKSFGVILTFNDIYRHSNLFALYKKIIEKRKLH